MTHVAKHRGPDGFGFAYFNGAAEDAGQSFHDQDRWPDPARPRVGLGSRRLAILDLSAAGTMPMQIEDGQLWITYNGEIYNYVELRAELESGGCEFNTRTDTEVILRAYQRWGADCVNHFHGMWSFAIYDRLERYVFCSRDRFGIKPFYYFLTPSLFLFGSEIKQILEYPDVPRAINETVASQFLAQGTHDHSDETFFSGIRQLPAGHSLHLLLSESDFSIRLEKYWELPLHEPGDKEAHREQEYIEKFRDLFRRSIRRHLRSDVPVGSCLSGGLDSSSIVAVASAENDRRPIHSFSSCFENDSLDERPYIHEIVSSAYVVPHLVFPNAESFWKDLNCLLWHQDEPVSSSSVYAQWSVMRAARQARIPVLLDGQGGDEILCGYRKFYVFHLWHMLKRADPRVVPEAVAWLGGAGGRNWSWKHAKRYVPHSRNVQRSMVERTCDADFLERTTQFPAVPIGPGQSLRKRQKADLMRYSLPALLRYEDRNSMAHSIESRVPMLDHDLATFAVNCAPNLKLRDGCTKWILREALKGVLPDRVRLRKRKLGFETPQREWLAADSSGMIESTLAHQALAAGRILSQTKIRTEFRRFRDSQPGALSEMELFRVLSLELWAQVFRVA